MVEFFFLLLDLIARLYGDAGIYIIHFTPQTWNEARAICARDGGHLLEITSEEDWNKWIKLINSTSYPQIPGSYVYWFGLHAVNSISTGSPTYVWDPCKPMNYSTPLVSDLPFDHACVVMWIHREVAPGQYFNNWYKGRRCDLALPFICSHTESDSRCVPHCLVTIATVDEITCNNWCQIRDCDSQFIHQANKCYIHQTANTSETYDIPCICVLPDLTVTSSFGTQQFEDAATYYNFSDGNVDVTNNMCLAETTAVDSTSTISSSAALEITTTSDILHQEVTPTCRCVCQDLWIFDTDQDTDVVNITLEEKVDIIVVELTVDKKNTSVSQRRYTSANDDRASSVGIGAIAIGIIVTTFCIVVMIDLARIWHEIMAVVNELRRVFMGNKIEHGDP